MGWWCREARLLVGSPVKVFRQPLRYDWGLMPASTAAITRVLKSIDSGLPMPAPEIRLEASESDRSNR